VKKWHKVLIAVAVYEVVAYAYNNYVQPSSGSTLQLPLDGITYLMN
jgi:hypothetical protein